MSTPADGIRQPYCPATRAARRFGDAPFLVGSDVTISFNDFAQQVGCFTDKLRRDGIERREADLYFRQEITPGCFRRPRGRQPR